MASAARTLKMYVSNISWTVCHNELRQYFSKFGHIHTATVVFDKNTGLSKNYGFVYFSNKEGFDAAVDTKNHTLEGFTMKVSAATSTEN